MSGQTWQVEEMMKLFLVIIVFGAAVVLIIALFTLLVSRGLLVAMRASDAFGSYLALGLTLLIALPACINMGVVSGILPTKGLSLPFLSYGGSSLLVNLLAVGILLNISSQIKRPQALANGTKADKPNNTISS